MVVADGEGNIGVLVSIGGGIADVYGVDLGVQFHATNAPNIDKLAGLEAQVGGSIGIGAGLAAFNMGGEFVMGVGYEGVAVQVGGYLGVLEGFIVDLEPHGVFDHAWVWKIGR